MAAYAAGAAIGGMLAAVPIAAVGTLVSATGPAGRSAVVALAVAVLLVAATLEWTGRMGPLPERQIQVPRRWLLWPRRTAAAAAFGVTIGAGALTRLKHPTAYALAAVLLIAPSVAAAAAAGATYGAARGLALVATWITDRSARRRPPWPSLGAAPRALSRTLAVTAAASFAAALFLVT